MSILNPGSTHFDAATGASGYALIDYADYPAPATLVVDLDNNPAVVTASADN